MELVYLPEPMTRLGTFNTYSTWDDIIFSNRARKQVNHCKEVKTSEKNCSICQQKKKRILSDYMKSKQTKFRNPGSIQEEDEEAEDKEENKKKENN